MLDLGEIRRTLRGVNRAVGAAGGKVDGALACSVAEETPEGRGFGAAALRLSQAYQMEAATRDGRPVEVMCTLTIPFQLR